MVTLRNLRRFLLVLTVFLLLGSGLAQAAPSSLDVRVLVRALKFMQPQPSGELRLAIVYDSANRISEDEARTFLDVLLSEKINESFSFKAGLVPMERVGEVDVDLAYLSQGTESVYDVLADRGIMTIAIDSECAAAGTCVLSVSSKPRVEVLVNMQAADRVGAVFNSVFRMMITEH